MQCGVFNMHINRSFSINVDIEIFALGMWEPHLFLILAVFGGPPCETWTRSRQRPGGPLVLRSRPRPWGLLGLAARFYSQLWLANSLLLIALLDEVFVLRAKKGMIARALRLVSQHRNYAEHTSVCASLCMCII